MTQKNSKSWSQEDEGPFIPASHSLPEITFKAVILSVILVIVLAATNAYLGLKVGTTISASIPAAVISMGVLRLFRKSNILENNIVQTAASSGEAIIAGIAFILPAMIIIHYWNHFNYLETLWMALTGGIFGVLFSIPVRRILLFHPELKFPEGTAIGQVLKASAEQSGRLIYLIQGCLFGGGISFCQGGLQILSNSFQHWVRSSNGILWGVGIGLDPAVIAAGYIIGGGVALSTLVGIVIGWLLGVPVMSHFFPVAGDAADAALKVWENHLRYVGVGAMLTGSFWTLIVLMKPIYAGIRASFVSLRKIKMHERAAIPRTERDIPMNYVLWGIGLMCLPTAVLFYHYVNNPVWHLAASLKILMVVVGVIFTLVVGFIFSVVGAYFAGLIGSTNSPTSALSLATLILMSLLIMAILEPSLHFSTNPLAGLVAISMAIMVASLLGAASICNETVQDFKAGYIVGATPWKQQVMLIIGTVIASLVAPLILQLLFEAYGIGGVFPRPGMASSQMLAAPQAGMMAALAQAAFMHHLPLSMLGIGVIIGILCIVVDQILKKWDGGLSILAMGFGIYLPLDSSVPLVIGGFASYIINYFFEKNRSKKEIVAGHQRGLTLACGLVAGAALMGVILAIPFAIAQSTDVLKIVSEKFADTANGLSVVVTILLLIWIYRVVCKSKNK